MSLSTSAIESAISAIESGGQSFTLDGITYTAASLPALYDMLRKERNASLRTGGTRPLVRAFGFSSMGYGSTGDNANPVYTVSE